MTVTTTRAAETWAHMTDAVDPMPVCVALDYATDDGSELHEACAAVEAVAQQHLDTHPNDHAARRLLGEWLTACGDERGPGYVALGECKKEPCRSYNGRFVWFNAWYYEQLTGVSHADYSQHLPGAWYDKFGNPSGNWCEYPTRRAAENAAARAFLRLPPERRAALLKGEM